MPEFQRVRLEESGHEVSVAVIRDGMTPINKPATDRHGQPLPPSFGSAPTEQPSELTSAAPDEPPAAESSKTRGAGKGRASLAEQQTSVATRDGEVTTGGESATSEEDSK